jgi:hypothetical protein
MMMQQPLHIVHTSNSFVSLQPQRQVLEMEQWLWIVFLHQCSINTQLRGIPDLPGVA